MIPFNDEQIKMLLVQNPIFQSLDEGGKLAVIDGISEEMAKLDHNRVLSDAGIALYKKRYLDEEVPIFLQNMLDGQMANDELCRRPASDPKGPLDHALRESRPVRGK